MLFQKPTTYLQELTAEGKKKWRSIFWFVLFIAAIVLVSIFAGKPLLKIIEDPAQFRTWVEAKGAFAWVVFLAIQIVQVIIALIPGEPVELVAGYAFGIWLGTLLSMIGIVLGSALVFIFSRKYGLKLIEVFISKEKLYSYGFIKDSQKLYFILFLFFLIPGTPKDTLTYFAGLTPISLKTFLLLISIARIPSVLSSTLAGNALGMQEYKSAIIIYAITIGVSLLGVGIYRCILRKRQDKQTV